LAASKLYGITRSVTVQHPAYGLHQELKDNYTNVGCAVGAAIALIQKKERTLRVTSVLTEGDRGEACARARNLHGELLTPSGRGNVWMTGRILARSVSTLGDQIAPIAVAFIFSS
jgi:hypothetical protein